MTDIEILEQDWTVRLLGKTLHTISPMHNGNGTPHVRMTFTDGTVFSVQPRNKGVYFEGCLTNILRKAQPVSEVTMVKDGGDTLVTIESQTFPLVMLSAINKGCETKEFPFDLVMERAPHD